MNQPFLGFFTPRTLLYIIISLTLVRFQPGLDKSQTERAKGVIATMRVDGLMFCAARLQYPVLITH